MNKKPKEWLRQADYDMETAEFMFKGARYFYVVFMVHLSIEKALKALYHEKLGEIPPKTHNLIYLLNKIGIKPPEDIAKFLIKLNEASVITRYPDDLKKIITNYTREVVKEILTKSKEAMVWIKSQF